MRSLTRLEIDGSRCDDKLVATILNQCVSLKFLNIGNCMGLKDSIFSLADINAPLEELDLAFLKQVFLPFFFLSNN